MQYGPLEIGWESRIAHSDEPAAWRVYPWIRSNHHANTEGFYPCPKKLIQISCRITEAECERSLEFLSAERLVSYDHLREIVLDRQALLFQTIQSPTQVEGAMRKLRRVGAGTPLWHEFWELCMVHAPALADAVATEFTDKIMDPPDPSGVHTLSEGVTGSRIPRSRSSSRGGKSNVPLASALGSSDSTAEVCEHGDAPSFCEKCRVVA